MRQRTPELQALFPLMPLAGASARVPAPVSWLPHLCVHDLQRIEVVLQAVPHQHGF